MFIFQNSQSEQKSASKNEHRKKTIEKKTNYFIERFR